MFPYELGMIRTAVLFKVRSSAHGSVVLNQPNVLVDDELPTDTYHATYHYPFQPPSTAVPLALMEITDSIVTNLPPMYDTASLDTDALDDLFDPTLNRNGHEGRVTFTYYDYTITVKSHGRIVLQAPNTTR